MPACSCSAARPPPSDPHFDDNRHLVDRHSVGWQPWSMLEHFRRHAGELVHRGTLLQILPGQPSPAAIDVYVHRLRRALATTPHRIETVRGFGYVLSNTADARREDSAR